MSEAPAAEIEAPTIDSMAAFSDKLKELTESLALLYIRNNASGRNKFRDKWPDVALFLFGEELIKFDNDGATDRDRRSELEVEAGDRRAQIRQTLSELIDKSVDQGSLLFDYVGGVIDLYGVGISKLLYAEDVIERVRPGVLASCVTVQDADAAKKAAEETARDEVVSKKAAALNDSVADQGHKMPLEDQKLSVEEQSILSNTSAKGSGGDALDDIKPIETETAAPSQRTLNNPMSEDKPPEAKQPEEALPEIPVIETAKVVEPSIEPVQEDVAQNVTAPEEKKAEVIPAPEVTPEPEKLEEKSLEQPKEQAKTASPRPMSEALDSIKPIDTGPAPDEAPTPKSETKVSDVPQLPPEPPVEAPQDVAVEKVVADVIKEDAPKEPSVENKKAEEAKPIEASSVDPVKEETTSEPVLKEPAADVPKIDVSKTEVVEKLAPEAEPAGKVEKGTYVALFNGLAQVV